MITIVTPVTPKEFYSLDDTDQGGSTGTEVFMTAPDEEQVRKLAKLAGIEINEEEVPEVTNRFQSLILELDRLKELDIDGVEPVVIFPDDDE